MPIEILPQGGSAWVEPSTKANILFLAEDPFWKTKTGQTNAGYAILYRGGQGFLEKSTNGGYTWTSILPYDQPEWFGGDSWKWLKAYAPRPLPRGSAPYGNELRYVAFASNPVNSGEHYVLCDYTLVDGGGPVGSEWDVHISWVLYTTDDWLTHKWQVVINDATMDYAPISNATSTLTLSYSDTASPGIHATRNQFDNIILWTDSNGVGAAEEIFHLSSFGGNVIEQGSASGVVPGNLQPEMFNFNGNYLYCAAVVEDREVDSVKIYRMQVYEWDISNSTPSLVTYESGDLPHFGLTTQSAKVSGNPPHWHLTDAGRLCLMYGIEKTVNGENEWYLFYFDVNTKSFSTLTKYKDSIAEGIIYRRLDFCAQTIDNSNKMLVVEVDHEYGPTFDPDDSHYLYEYIMVAGAWDQQFNKTMFYSEGDDPAQRYWYINPMGSCKLSPDGIETRVLFFIGYYSYNTSSGSSYPRFYTYDTVLNTFTYHAGPNGEFPPLGGSINPGLGLGSGDLPTKGPRCLAFNGWDNPVPGKTFWGSSFGQRIGPNEPYPWNYYTSQWTDSDSDVRQLWDTQYNPVTDTTNMCKAAVRFSSPNYLIDVTQVTVGVKPPDIIRSRKPSGGKGHQMAASLDGAYIWVSTSTWNDPSDDNDLETKLDRLMRQPDGISGKVGYPIIGAAGLFHVTLDTALTLTMHNNMTSYASLVPWGAYTDGVLAYGLLKGGSSPTQPGQVYGLSDTYGSWEYLDINTFTDPCRAVFEYGGKIYAIIYDSVNGLELWVEDAIVSDDGDDISPVSIVGITDVRPGNVAAADTRDGTILVTGLTGDPIVALAVPPYSIWYDLTINHRIDKDVTGLLIIE